MITKPFCSDRIRSFVKFALRWTALSLMLASAAGCVPDDESGVVGTGYILRGTVSEQRVLASAELQIRSQSGERSSVRIARDGQYETQPLLGTGPWLLRSSQGNGDFQYGVGYSSNLSHVHGYIDIITRVWFLEQHGISDMDSMFEDQKPLPRLPTGEEFELSAQPHIAIIYDMLRDYGLTEWDLFRRDFRNDNTLIDRFLKANPILLDESQAYNVRTDPQTGIQSSYQAGILLGDIRLTPDATAPSTPENFRSFTTSSAGVLLVWDESFDNTAVVDYEIFRNGEYIGFTPYLTFSDRTAKPYTDYNYTVATVDLAGNLSAPASLSINFNLAAVDTVAPPAPHTLAKLSSTARKVELNWIHDDVADVARFNVFRGHSLDGLSLFTQVNSARLLDLAVSSSAEYWYAVSAVDMRGNESARSEPLKVETAGVVIDRPERLSTPIALTIPDTSTLDCEELFPVSVIDNGADITINAGCYRVEQDIRVSSLGVLRLQPGVVLKFSSDTGIVVSQGGSLVSVGTTAMPVVLTGTQPSRGSWRGVEFDRAQSALNRISHTVIEYAGTGSLGASVKLISSFNAFSNLRFDNSLVRYGNNYGISILGKNTSLRSFSSNLITQNQRAAYVNHTSLPLINDGSVFTNNGENFIHVPLGDYDLDITINDPGLPLELTGIDQLYRNPARSIVINEGVEMYFHSNTAFNIRGSLAIRGSAEKPVRLTSKNPGPGSWQGLHLLEGSNALLSHVVVENAGQPSDQNPEGASVFAVDTRFSMNNVTMRSSSSYGFHAQGDRVIVDNAQQISNVDNARDDIVDPATL